MIGLSSIPLAFMAGVIGLLSPCVLPMLPAIIASATQSSKKGLVCLAAGLSIAFALAGTLVTFMLLSAGFSPDILRDITAVILVIMGLLLLFKSLSDRFSYGLSRLVSFLPAYSNETHHGLFSQFMIGASLGLVWLPCVGPTIGSAIALASQGQDMLMAFTVMLAYGLGTAIPLIFIGSLAGSKMKNLRFSADITRKAMGVTFLLLGLAILTGFDHWLEILAMAWLPDWALDI